MSQIGWHNPDPTQGKLCGDTKNRAYEIRLVGEADWELWVCSKPGEWLSLGDFPAGSDGTRKAMMAAIEAAQAHEDVAVTH